MLPLSEGLENFSLDGVRYEAFNTSQDGPEHAVRYARWQSSRAEL